MQGSTRFFHMYNYVVQPIKRETEGVPDVYTQAENLNGRFTRISHGNPENSVANFSPSILRHKGTTYIAWRSQPEPFGFRWDMKYFYLNNQPTDIYIGVLADDSTILGAKPLRAGKHRLSCEDPRLFEGPDGEMYVQFVASSYASKYDKGGLKFFDNPKVIVCHVNEHLDAVSATIPPIGENLVKGKTEKNWCFFSHYDELRCLYSTRPIKIECERGPAVEINSDVLGEVTGGAPTFNSLPPIDIGSGYLVFYHWKHMQPTEKGSMYLLYHLGAYMLDRDMSKVTHVIKRPLFSGSLDDRLISWTNEYGQTVSHQPACILPFGAYVEDQQLVMALGVNDAFNGIFRCPLKSITNQMVEVV
jgi:predicted GH43/DUF377 family glycosyl hydrolase